MASTKSTSTARSSFQRPSLFSIPERLSVASNRFTPAPTRRGKRHGNAPFPYKRTFVTKPPEFFFQNLCDLLYVSIDYTPPLKYPVSILADKEVYEAVNIITDLYTEEARVQARLCNLMSPLEVWKQREDQIRRRAREVYGNESNFSLREILFFDYKEATAFSPSVSKVVYDSLLEKPGTVFDPFSGWGDRAIGALASDKVLHYQGVDCNENLREGYAQLQRDLDKKQKLSFCFGPIEVVEKNFGRYDLIFTSPPFFDFEIYQDDHKDPKNSQSIRMGKTYADWLKMWYAPVLQKLTEHLNSGGLMALYVGDTYRCPSLIQDTMDILLSTPGTPLTYIQSIKCNNLPILVFQRSATVVTPDVVTPDVVTPDVVTLDVQNTGATKCTPDSHTPDPNCGPLCDGSTSQASAQVARCSDQ